MTFILAGSYPVGKLALQQIRGQTSVLPLTRSCRCCLLPSLVRRYWLASRANRRPIWQWTCVKIFAKRRSLLCDEGSDGIRHTLLFRFTADSRISNARYYFCLNANMTGSRVISYWMFASERFSVINVCGVLLSFVGSGNDHSSGVVLAILLQRSFQSWGRANYPHRSTELATYTVYRRLAWCSTRRSAIVTTSKFVV